MRLQQYLTEKYIDGFNVRGKYVEVFKNPSSKEYREFKGSSDMVRAFLVGSDIYIWNVFKGLHNDIDRVMKFGRNALPVMLFMDRPSDRDVSVVITDYSKGTRWYHNSDIILYLEGDSYLAGKDIDVSYFDESIVGRWEEL